MAFGSKKQAVIAKPSFKERLIGVKSMFKKAHEDASKLNAEMQADIDSKKQKVKLFEDEIGFILGIKFDTMTIDPMYIEWYKELSALRIILKVRIEC